MVLAATASPNFWDTLDPYSVTGLVRDTRPLANGSGNVNPGPPPAKLTAMASQFWLPSNPIFWAGAAIAVTAAAMGLSSGRIGARVAGGAHLGPLEVDASAGTKKEPKK